MSIWVIRGGKFGEYENRFINESKVYLTRDGFKTDLNKIPEQNELRTVLDDFYPTLPSSKLASWSDQIWSFAHDVQQKDWIIVPSKLSPVIHVGEITGGYNYEKNGSDLTITLEKSNGSRKISLVGISQQIFYIN